MARSRCSRRRPRRPPAGSFEIHGADLAAIDPPRHVPNGATLFAGIAFHAGVPCERLGFADREFRRGQRAVRPRVHGHGARAGRGPPRAPSRRPRTVRAAPRAVGADPQRARIARAGRAGARGHEDPAQAAAPCGGRIRLGGCVAARPGPSSPAATTRLQQAAASSASPHLLHVVIDGVQKLLGLRRELGAAGVRARGGPFRARGAGRRAPPAGPRGLRAVGGADGNHGGQRPARGLRMPGPWASVPRRREPRRLAACAESTLRRPAGDPAGAQASGGGMRVLHSIPPQRRNIGCPEETGFRWNSRRA